MFVDGIGFRKIILCTKRVDMRRGVDGLSAYVMLNYHLDPTDREFSIFFRGRSAKTIKGICSERNGTVLYTLPLAPETHSSIPGMRTKPDLFLQSSTVSS